ncbi:nuclear transport factor 2 family protein [Aquiflexum sp. LQ15W]|uniref:nuclear transport factor 2 family protein n=1 Tax=Cyclobacteriaceae TaxID=563798 RepID=UPI001F13B451|nr:MULTISPECIES: nuclear transport factor 2 family protein [Cyclobacteriaceae]MCH6199113.1 nuclear transport factor 2 family protein [Cognataquiflexum nitidum]MCL6258371.1 nuclear transport factor 2 family protein [Aquiflexum sp. TKW24L]
MDNSKVIHNFYNAFAKGKVEEMLSCYHKEIIFEDPVFGALKGEEAKSMWKMLLARSKGNLKVTFSDVKVVRNSGEAKWEAIYPFGSEKRIVHNKIKAEFEFKDGKIIKHTDKFDLWKWSRMALGFKGVLLGWSPLVQNKVKSHSKDLLKKFMEK